MKALLYFTCWVLLTACASVGHKPKKYPPVDTVYSEDAFKKVSYISFDPKETGQAEMRLLASSRSGSVDDRRAAAYATGELSSSLNPKLSQRLFEMHLRDPDPGVRYLALSGCTGCTGYTWSFPINALPILKLLRKDSVKEVRELATSLYKQAAKIQKENK